MFTQRQVSGNKGKFFSAPHTFFLVVLFAGLALRFAGTPIVSADMKWFLLPWFSQIEPEGFGSLAHQVGNYGLLYQTLIALLTYIPLPAVFLYKFVSVVFDVALAFSAALIARRVTGTGWREKPARMAFLAIMFLPPFVINSGWWGQCDSMYSLAALWALYFLYERRYPATGVALGFAFALKLQTIFIMPLVVTVYVLRRRWPFPELIYAAGVFWGTGGLAYAFGRSLLAPLTIYAGQTGDFPKMVVNAPSFWYFFPDNFALLAKPAVVVCAAILAIGFFAIILKKISIDSWQQYLATSAWMIWTCFLFLPAMHERYSYLLQVVLILLAVAFRGYWPYLAVETAVTCVTYAKFFHLGPGVVAPLVVAELATWATFTSLIVHRAHLNSLIADK
ncbi:Gpi18-like mannosyltransferase [Arcanobacterium wilhelmae]|uniref:Gpi18-like mannosyltransferase n=1 Tax=Arcanobacterium wilhelmae TaxID=1803177 RepID=A0ABT9N8H2_9ACTO|nr:hypothetical protein [Arcanobacterium wilhelmae]MDP9800007.1 Gpi18-like mannosyltransferase [Arcanobacterium wilhelmae]WFN89505.1 hypothetical protein P8A24_04640 [Arcanobacterium wilhelmae]